ncbi:hypothetical protein DFH09DRAFT_1503860 [Mycena vulgaris]|nr:hypothetical protein DFH09DRAFT_1503860 [Mycena vulgaris]
MLNGFLVQLGGKLGGGSDPKIRGRVEFKAKYICARPSPNILRVWALGISPRVIAVTCAPHFSSSLHPRPAHKHPTRARIGHRIRPSPRTGFVRAQRVPACPHLVNCSAASPAASPRVRGLGISPRAPCTARAPRWSSSPSARAWLTTSPAALPCVGVPARAPRTAHTALLLIRTRLAHDIPRRIAASTGTRGLPEAPAPRSPSHLHPIRVPRPPNPLEYGDPPAAPLHSPHARDSLRPHHEASPGARRCPRSHSACFREYRALVPRRYTPDRARVPPSTTSLREHEGPHNEGAARRPRVLDAAPALPRTPIANTGLSVPRRCTPDRARVPPSATSLREHEDPRRPHPAHRSSRPRDSSRLNEARKNADAPIRTTRAT